MTELKPCPFCGKIPRLKTDIRYPQGEQIAAYEVVCSNWECIIYNADDVYFPTPQDAIIAWNRRTKNDK